MCAEAALVELELPASQGNFEGLRLVKDAEVLRHPPADGQIDTQPMTESLSSEVSSTSIDVSDIPVILATYTSMGKVSLPMRGEAVARGDEANRIRLSDEAETLTLTLRFWTDGLINFNFTMRYSEQPLDAALASARFFETLVTTPGMLSIEPPEPNSGPNPIVDLPLPIPESSIADQRERLRLLEALYEIRQETGVEIQYPTESEAEQDLDNLNFVLEAVRSGWVVQHVDGIKIPMTEADVRGVLAQIKGEGEVRRAFIFDLPEESYRVFGQQVDLGLSRRYLADARLVTPREEIEGWLGGKPGSQDALPLQWEPVDDIPVHVFFAKWPKMSMASVERELHEFELIYGFSSEAFGQAWADRASWARDVPDGKRWFSLIRGREELAQEP